jgi:hypothetical protein
MLNKILVFEKIEYRLLELGASWIYSEFRDETLHIFQHLVIVEPSYERLVCAEKTVLACFCVRYDINHVIFELRQILLETGFLHVLQRLMLLFTGILRSGFRR